MAIPRRAWFAIIACVLLLAGVMAVMLIDDWAAQVLGRTIGNKSLVASALLTYGTLTTVMAIALVQPVRTWNWFSRNRRHLLVTSGTVLLSFGTMELMLRLLRPEWTLPGYKLLFSRRLHHRNPTGVSAYCGYFEKQAVVARLNADGLRSDYELEEFLKYPQRVVILGDSFTFGHGVTQEQVYPQVLETELRLRKGEDQVAVLNAGVISYSPFLEDRLFRGTLKKYKPTLTILALDLSDIGDDFHYESMLEPPTRSEILEPAGDDRPFSVSEDAFDVPWYTHLAVHRCFPMLQLWLAAPYREWRGLKLGRDHPLYYRFELEVGGVLETSRFFILRHPLSQTQPYFDRTWQSILRIAAEAESVGSRFALVLIPRYHQWSNRECPDNWEKREYALDEPHEFAFFDYFHNRRTDAPFPIISLLLAFQATPEFPLVFRRDPHLNAAGHAFVGRTLTRELESLSAGLEE